MKKSKVKTRYVNIYIYIYIPGRIIKDNFKRN